jgi:hypothetical protein
MVVHHFAGLYVQNLIFGYKEMFQQRNTSVSYVSRLINRVGNAGTREEDAAIKVLAPVVFNLHLSACVSHYYVAHISVHEGWISQLQSFHFSIFRGNRKVSFLPTNSLRYKPKQPNNFLSSRFYWMLVSKSSMSFLLKRKRDREELESGLTL